MSNIKITNNKSGYQEQTINSYNQNARLWDMTRGRFWKEYNHYIYDILDKLFEKREVVNILDAGCGNGRLLFVINKYMIDRNINKDKINYTGFDPAEELINYAKTTFPEYKDNLFVSNILDFNNTENIKYCVIFSFAVFHHFNKKDFKNNYNYLYNLLKKDGVLCVTIWDIWYKYKREVWRFYFDNFFNKNYQLGDLLLPLFQHNTMRFVHAYTTFNIFNILFVNKLIQKINHLFGKNNKNKIYKNQILELKRTYTKDKKECNILLIVNK